MTKEIIAAALEAEGLKASGHGLGIPEDREATVMIGAPGEILTVTRIAIVELRDKYIALQTTKDERFVFAYEDVLGLRLLAKSQARERSAGFVK